MASILERFKQRPEDMSDFSDADLSYRDADKKRCELSDEVDGYASIINLWEKTTNAELVALGLEEVLQETKEFVTEKAGGEAKEYRAIIFRDSFNLSYMLPVAETGYVEREQGELEQLQSELAPVVARLILFDENVKHLGYKKCLKKLPQLEIPRYHILVESNGTNGLTRIAFEYLKGKGIWVIGNREIDQEFVPEAPKEEFQELIREAVCAISEKKSSIKRRFSNKKTSQPDIYTSPQEND